MSSTALRVIIDTNLYISYLLPPLDSRRSIVRLFEYALQEQLTLLLPGPLEQELLDTVLNKAYLRARIPRQKVVDLLELLQGVSEIVATIALPYPTIVRDYKDDYLLAYASVGQADYLVTGDSDLLVLRDSIAHFRIVSPAQLLDILAERSNRS